MNCPNCQTEMVLSPNVLLSNPPKYQYECPNCCQPPIIVDYPEIKFKFIPKEKIKIDTSKIKSFEDVALIFECLGGLYIPKDSPDLEKLRHLF